MTIAAILLAGCRDTPNNKPCDFPDNSPVISVENGSNYINVYDLNGSEVKKLDIVELGFKKLSDYENNQYGGYYREIMNNPLNVNLETYLYLLDSPNSAYRNYSINKTTALPEINSVPDNSIPDLPLTRAYAPEVYKLYRAGILQGSDAEHSCKPLDNIKRGEVAAILTRMMDNTKRVRFSIGK